VNGQLAADDCRDLDIFVPGDDPSPTDPWKIEVPDRTFVTLTMRSNVFDTYLSLTGKDNKLFGSNDDFEDLTYDSQIRISLNPGTYSALSSTVDDAGPYTLTLNSEPLRTCDVPDLGTGPTTGSVTTEDCRVLDLVVPSTDSKVTDAYRLRVSAKTVYTFELSSTNFTPAIRVYDGTNTLVFSRAASTTAKALKLDVLLWAGDYTVLIVSQDRPGDYTLTTSKREPPTCEATVIPLNGSTEGRLVASDCRLADVLSGVFSTSKTDVLKLVVPEKRAVTIAADSDSFPPLLVVYNEADLLVGSALNQSLRTHAELTATLPAGTYTIVIANVLGLEGPYVVKTTSPEP
jgi:hypothetical protein